MSAVLVQFVFRVTFGMAVAMAATPSRLVTSGFFRVHLWVLMGLNTVAALAWKTTESPESSRWAFPLAIVLAVGSYVGAVVWLYERHAAGRAILAALAMIAAAGALQTGQTRYLEAERSAPSAAATSAEALTSGLLLGATATAMFLGHWYLNTPTMQLGPLRRLIQLMGCGVAARALAAAVGLAALAMADLNEPLAFLTWVFLAFRWLAGLAGVAALAWLTWLTLRVPNTQSATGILYAAVVLVILGELLSQLLSSNLGFPL